MSSLKIAITILFCHRVVSCWNHAKSMLIFSDSCLSSPLPKQKHTSCQEYPHQDDPKVAYLQYFYTENNFGTSMIIGRLIDGRLIEAQTCVFPKLRRSKLLKLGNCTILIYDLPKQCGFVVYAVYLANIRIKKHRSHRAGLV